MGRIFKYAILLGYLSLILAIQNNGDVTPVKSLGSENTPNSTQTNARNLRNNENKENSFAKRIGDSGLHHQQQQDQWNHLSKPKSNQMSQSPGLSSFISEPGSPNGNKRRNLSLPQARNGFSYPQRHRDSSGRGFIPPFSQELLPTKNYNKLARNSYGGRSLSVKERPPRLPPHSGGQKSFGHQSQVSQESRNYNSYHKFGPRNQNAGGRNSRFHHQRQNSKVCDACNSVPWVPLLNVPNAYRQERNQHFESHNHNSNYPPFDYHAMSSNNHDFLIPSTPLVPPAPTVLDGTISSSYGLPAGNIPTGHGLLAPLNHLVANQNSYSAQSSDYSNALTYFTPPSILESSPIPELSPVPIVPIYDSGTFYSGNLLDSTDIGLVPPATNQMSVSNVVFTIAEGNSHNVGAHHASNTDTRTAHSTIRENLNFKPSSGVLSDTQTAHSNVHHNLNFDQSSVTLTNIPTPQTQVHNNLNFDAGGSGRIPQFTHSNINEHVNFQHNSALSDVHTAQSLLPNHLNFQQNTGDHSNVQAIQTNLQNNVNFQQNTNTHAPHANLQNNLNFQQNTNTHIPHANVQNNLNFQQNTNTHAPHANLQNNVNFQQNTNTHAPHAHLQNNLNLNQNSGDASNIQTTHTNLNNIQHSSSSPSDIQASHAKENLNFKHNLIDANDFNNEQHVASTNTQNQQVPGVDIVKSVPLAEFSTASDRTPGFSTENIVLQNPLGDEKITDNNLSDFVPPPPPPYFNTSSSAEQAFNGGGNFVDSRFQTAFRTSEIASQPLSPSASWLFLDAQTSPKGTDQSEHHIPFVHDQIASVVNSEFHPSPHNSFPIVSPVKNAFDANQSKKIQIIIPYTTKSKNDLDANSYESVRHEVFHTLQSLSNKSELEYLAKLSTTSKPSKGGEGGTSQGNLNFTSGKVETGQGAEIERNKKYVTEMQHILAKNIKELLLREIEQTGKENFSLQNNIDNWTALEFSNHKNIRNKKPKEIITQTLSVTSIPGTSISHLLLPSKKIPEEYFVTTPSPFFDETLTNLFKVNSTSVHSRPFTARPSTSLINGTPSTLLSTKKTTETTSSGSNYTVVGKSRVNYWGGKTSDNLVVPDVLGSTKSNDGTTTSPVAKSTSSGATNKIEIVTPVSVTPKKSDTTRRTTRHVRVTERTIFKRTNSTARHLFNRFKTQSSIKKINTASLSRPLNSTKLENVSTTSGDSKKNYFRITNSFKSRRRNTGVVTTPSPVTARNRTEFGSRQSFRHRTDAVSKYRNESVKNGTETVSTSREVSVKNGTDAVSMSRNESVKNGTDAVSTSRNESVKNGTDAVSTSRDVSVKNGTENVKKENSTYPGESRNSSDSATAIELSKSNKSEELQSINDIFPFRNKELPWEAFDVTNSRQNVSGQRKSLVRQVKSRRSRRATARSLRTHSSARYSELGT